MAEELKNLIERIQKEGVEAAQEKAKEVEAQAVGNAAHIIEKAEQEAEKLLGQAHERILKAEQASQASLKQAGRDFIITLRKEVLTMLGMIVRSRVHEALSTAELAKIITDLAQERLCQEKGEIVVTMSKDDLEKLEKNFLALLGNEIKKGIRLRASDDISGGFFISYDSGKSYYDFTDQALADYIVRNLQPRLAEVLSIKE